VPRELTSGRWFDVTSAEQHANLKRFGQTPPPSPAYSQARVQMGTWTGPGRYFVLSYSQPCPRGCCYDSVYEVLTAEDVARAARETIREYASLLREARKSTTPAAAGPSPEP
jgi:hypothetical protein